MCNTPPINVENEEHDEISQHNLENIYDHGQWKNIDKNLRDLLVEKGPTKYDLTFPKDENFGHFSTTYYIRKLQNGELYDRKWLIYSNDLTFPKDENLRHFSTTYYIRKLQNGELYDRKWLIYSNDLTFPKDGNLRHFSTAYYIRKLQNGELYDRKWLIYSNDLTFPKDENFRHFSTAYYIRKLQNGELYDRKWLIYSTSLDKVYCFFCKLFISKPRTSQLPNEGTKDRRNFSVKLKSHETSNEYITNMSA